MGRSRPVRRAAPRRVARSRGRSAPRRSRSHPAAVPRGRPRSTRLVCRRTPGTRDGRSMITLALDASTYRGTVAVLEQDRVVVQGTVAMRGRDAERLMPAVDEALRAAGTSLKSVGRVVCGAGPGSFTSLRIAASLAKGIAVGRDIPLYAVSSLALIVAGNVSDGPRGVRRYLAVLDALRGESYAAEFEHDAGVVRHVGEMRLVASLDV